MNKFVDNLSRVFNDKTIIMKENREKAIVKQRLKVAR